MATVFDYLKWRGDLSFAQDPLNPVDGLIFCALSYIPFVGQAAETPNEPIALRDAAADFLSLDDYESRVRAKNDAMMLRAAAETARFGGCKMVLYRDQFVPEEETQFAAMTFLLPDGTAFVAFRGTDRSLVGWKEDFNMSFQEAVPAQLLAQDYVREVAAEYVMPLRLGGHSKGGNLAAWAAVHLPEKLQGKRLLAAYNNDGPGFHADLLDTPAYRRVEDRLHTYIPESSIVGVLLVHAEDYDVIDSTSHAAMQHEALSWQVMGNRFVHLGQRSQLGQMSDDVLREWLDSVSQEDREAFCDALYSILSMGGRAKTFEDLRKGGFSGWAALWKEYAGADERKKQILTEIFGRLAIDVKDELMKAAGQGLRSAGHGIRTVGQNLMGRHEPDKTQTK